MNGASRTSSRPNATLRWAGVTTAPPSGTNTSLVFPNSDDTLIVANTGSSPRVSTYTASRSPIFASTGSTTGRPRQSRMFSTGITGGTLRRLLSSGESDRRRRGGRGVRAGLLGRLVGDGQLVAADPAAAGEGPAD